jgi:CheY-like chemotaxis protein
MSKPLALIIEDDPQLGQIFGLSLRGEFETETIADGSEALAWLACSVPDVIVLDLHLPGAGGTEIYRRIRADARLAKTRIIVSSADAQLAETLREDVDLILLKPVSPMQLRNLAARLRPEG